MTNLIFAAAFITNALAFIETTGVVCYANGDPVERVAKFTRGCGVQYVGPSNDAPIRTTGIIVSRIITDHSCGPNHGEQWCLVEFGDGPPYVAVPLTNLVTIPIVTALKDFPLKGLETVRGMLKEYSR